MTISICLPREHVFHRFLCLIQQLLFTITFLQWHKLCLLSHCNQRKIQSFLFSDSYLFWTLHYTVRHSDDTKMLIQRNQLCLGFKFHVEGVDDSCYGGVAATRVLPLLHIYKLLNWEEGLFLWEETEPLCLGIINYQRCRWLGGASSSGTCRCGRGKLTTIYGPFSLKTWKVQYNKYMHV